MTERAVASIHFWKIAFLHLVPFHTSLVSLFLIRALLGLSCSQAATWSPEKVWLHKDRTLVLGCRAVLSTGQTCTVCFGWLFLIFLLLHFNLLFSQWFLFIFNGLKVCVFFFLIVRTLLTIWGHNVCIVTSLKGLRPGSPSKGLYQILYPDSLSKQKCPVNRAEQVELNGDGADPVSCLLFNPVTTSFPFAGSSFQTCHLLQGLFFPAVQLCFINILLMLSLCSGNLGESSWIRCCEVLQNPVTPRLFTFQRVQHNQGVISQSFLWFPWH